MDAGCRMRSEAVLLESLVQREELTPSDRSQLSSCLSEIVSRRCIGPEELQQAVESAGKLSSRAGSPSCAALPWLRLRPIAPSGPALPWPDLLTCHDQTTRKLGYHPQCTSYVVRSRKQCCPASSAQWAHERLQRLLCSPQSGVETFCQKELAELAAGDCSSVRALSGCQ